MFDQVVHDNYERVPDNFFTTEVLETSMLSAFNNEHNSEERGQEAEAITRLYGVQEKSNQVAESLIEKDDV